MVAFIGGVVGGRKVMIAMVIVMMGDDSDGSDAVGLYVRRLATRLCGGGDGSNGGDGAGDSGDGGGDDGGDGDGEGSGDGGGICVFADTQPSCAV